MPPSFVFVVTLLVGTYLFLVGVAAIGFVRLRQQTPPSAPIEWPCVTVVVPPHASTDTALSVLEGCEYPKDHLDILLFSDDPEASPASEGEGNVPVRVVPVSERHSGPSSVPLQRILDTAEGEIILHVPADGEVSPGWIRSMVRRCTAHTPVVVGPTVVEHGDLFLPRLQALSHQGRMAWTAGASYVRCPVPSLASNWAARFDWFTDHDEPASILQQRFAETPIAFNSDADAVVTRPPATSFKHLLQRLSNGFNRAFHSCTGSVVAQGVGLWILHAVLLVSGVVAVALPTWRQPTLLALLAKMGGDVLLTLPAAKQYGQRGLFGSFVPTELMLMVAIPLAGLWGLLHPTTASDVDAPRARGAPES